jgi:serine phosphatase RsbU (regulator of sigma subunit)
MTAMTDGVESYHLFSLDPDDVLDAATEVLAEAAPDAEIRVFPLNRLATAAVPDLPTAVTARVKQAVASQAPVVARGGRCLVQPLVTRHRGGEKARSEAFTKVIGVAVLQSPTPLAAAAISQTAVQARRVAVALEHALLYEVQAQIAQQLQRRLLPREQPVVAGLEVGTKFCPRTAGAEIGGDFIDFVSLSPNQLAISVGDVSGKGIAAAAVTVITKYALRAITATLSWPTWPGEALRDLHNALQGQLDPESFVTVVFGLVDVTRRTLSVAAAGHPAPFIVRDGIARQPMVLTAPAIALVDYSEIEPLPTERLALHPGDLVLFFTDGLSELRDASGKFYEEARLPQVLAELAALGPAQLVDELYADALAWTERPPHDDIALVAVRLLDRQASQD